MNPVFTVGFQSDSDLQIAGTPMLEVQQNGVRFQSDSDL